MSTSLKLDKNFKRKWNFHIQHISGYYNTLGGRLLAWLRWTRVRVPIVARGNRQWPWSGWNTITCQVDQVKLHQHQNCICMVMQLYGQQVACTPLVLAMLGTLLDTISWNTFLWVNQLIVLRSILTTRLMMRIDGMTSGWTCTMGWTVPPPTTCMWECWLVVWKRQNNQSAITSCGSSVVLSPGKELQLEWILQIMTKLLWSVFPRWRWAMYSQGSLPFGAPGAIATPEVNPVVTQRSASADCWKCDFCGSTYLIEGITDRHVDIWLSGQLKSTASHIMTRILRNSRWFHTHILSMASQSQLSKLTLGCWRTGDVSRWRGLNIYVPYKTGLVQERPLASGQCMWWVRDAALVHQLKLHGYSPNTDSLFANGWSWVWKSGSEHWKCYRDNVKWAVW